MIIIDENNQERNVKGGEEYDEFMDRLNERANFFKMKSTGCASVDDKRLQDWSNPARPINQRRSGVGFYGGAYRKLEYEHVGIGVKLICVYLEEIEDVSVGTKMARIQDNKLIISTFNGSKPSSVVESFIILENDPPKTTVKRICQRCGRECGDGQFCSNKCRHKEEKKLFGTMKRQPVREKTSFNREKINDRLKYVLMVKETIDSDSR